MRKVIDVLNSTSLLESVISTSFLLLLNESMQCGKYSNVVPDRNSYILF